MKKTIFVAVMHRIKPFITTTALLALILAACEKHPVPKQQQLYEVSYSGELILGEPITFQSSAPSTSKFWWKFGDGNESIQQAPTHTYYTLKHNGTEILEDTVTLIVNGDIYRPNTKTFKLKPNVKKVAGTHVWLGGRITKHGNCCPGLVDHALNDTTFGSTIVDDYTVRSWGATLPYLADSNYFSNERTRGLYNAVFIKFTADTLYFKQRVGTDTGYAEMTWFHLY